MILANDPLRSHYNVNDRPFKIPEKHIDKAMGFVGTDGKWNSLIIYEDRKYRHRLETIVIKDDCVFLNIRSNKNTYKFPGGSRELAIPDIYQAENEVNEEARIKIRNLKKTDMTYATLFNRKPDDEYDYDYVYNEIYIADYDGEYDGIIDIRDVNERMYKYGKFYKYIDYRWVFTPMHREVIDKEFKARGLM